MDNFLTGLAAGMMAMIILGFIVAMMVDDPVTSFKKEAIENGAAYWCIEDHERVFSWNECEE